MWDKPKKYTALDLIKKEVAHRQKIAEEKGLDLLFLDAYHESIRYYPIWIRSERDRKYVQPDVLEAREEIIKDPRAGDVYLTEFKIGPRSYKIASRRRGSFLTNDVYYVMELYLNSRKVFGISEQHQPRTKGGKKYYALRITAYASEDWVDDFKKICAYEEKIEREAKPGPNPEDPAVIRQLEEDFNIKEDLNAAKAEGKSTLEKIQSRPAWSYWWVWVIILILMVLMLVKVVMLSR
jgi:hypothetical protein